MSFHPISVSQNIQTPSSSSLCTQGSYSCVAIPVWMSLCPGIRNMQLYSKLLHIIQMFCNVTPPCIFPNTSNITGLGESTSRPFVSEYSWSPHWKKIQQLFRHWDETHRNTLGCHNVLTITVCLVQNWPPVGDTWPKLRRHLPKCREWQHMASRPLSHWQNKTKNTDPTPCSHGQLWHQHATAMCGMPQNSLLADAKESFCVHTPSNGHLEFGSALS